MEVSNVPNEKNKNNFRKFIVSNILRENKIIIPDQGLVEQVEYQLGHVEPYLAIQTANRILWKELVDH